MSKPEFLTIAESTRRVNKLMIVVESRPMQYGTFLSLLIESKDFRQQWLEELKNQPFAAYRWETPALTRSLLTRPFECVVIDSAVLAETADIQPFAEQFQANTGGNEIVFQNLGKDATLIVPIPLVEHSVYAHLASFSRNAPEHQLQSFWKRVAIVMLEQLNDSPIWLNTAGAGVSWLHVRLDSVPKYYHYADYRNADYRIAFSC